jgi:hypothetical protein
MVTEVSLLMPPHPFTEDGTNPILFTLDVIAKNLLHVH